MLLMKQLAEQKRREEAERQLLRGGSPEQLISRSPVAPLHPHPEGEVEPEQLFDRRLEQLPEPEELPSSPQSRQLYYLTRYHQCPHIANSEIELRAEIGRGAQARVYRGFCRSTEVAVKQALGAGEVDVQKTRQEVEIVSQIHHPNLCLFMGACVQSDTILIVTELLEGDIETRLKTLPVAFDSLLELLPKVEQLSRTSTRSRSRSRIGVGPPPAPLSMRIQWARDAARGVAWLHNHSPTVVHRDLKPANFLYDRHGNVKVCDFGLSLLLDGQRCQQDETGTALYCAPETLSRNITSAESDVFAFGIALWEIATCVQFNKFAPKRFPDLKNRVLEGFRPPIPPEMLSSLASLLQRCWHEDPAQRPNFDTIVTELEHIMQECLVSERMASIRFQLWSPHDTLWNRFFGYRATEVSWESFQAAVVQAHSFDPSNPFTRRDLRCLQALALDKQDGMVHLKRWGELLGWFAPFDDGFFARILKIFECQSFHVALDAVDAEDKLARQPIGSFLFRFSGNNFGNFCVSRVNRQRMIVHELIPNTPGQGLLYRDTFYSSFQSLVNTSGPKYGLIVPYLTSNVPFCDLLKLEEEEEAHRLGGYLIFDEEDFPTV